ncbi:fluoride efflux transporter CrcB [soil metagenome]
MKIILAIGLGSFLGGISRYLLVQYIQTKSLSAFPFGTLAVNVTGCLFIGIVLGLYQRQALPVDWVLFLAIGVLGGFTTFSAFSSEAVTMLRDGQIISSITYILGSVLLGLLATAAGLFLVKLI